MRVFFLQIYGRSIGKCTDIIQVRYIIHGKVAKIEVEFRNCTIYVEAEISDRKNSPPSLQILSKSGDRIFLGTKKVDNIAFDQKLL